MQMSHEIEQEARSRAAVAENGAARGRVPSSALPRDARCPRTRAARHSYDEQAPETTDAGAASPLWAELPIQGGCSLVHILLPPLRRGGHPGAPSPPPRRRRCSRQVPRGSVQWLLGLSWGTSPVPALSASNPQARCSTRLLDAGASLSCHRRPQGNLSTAQVEQGRDPENPLSEDACLRLIRPRPDSFIFGTPSRRLDGPSIGSAHALERSLPVRVRAQAPRKDTLYMQSQEMSTEYASQDAPRAAGQSMDAGMACRATGPGR